MKSVTRHFVWLVGKALALHLAASVLKRGVSPFFYIYILADCMCVACLLSQASVNQSCGRIMQAMVAAVRVVDTMSSMLTAATVTRH